MKLTNVKNAVTSRLGRQALVLSKHSPKILFVAGVVGVVGTAVLAARATLKLDEVLEHHSKKLSEADHAMNISSNYTAQDHQRDMVVLYTQTSLKMVRLYAPAVVLGVVSIASLTGAHLVLSRRNVALTAAYAALDKGFRQYRERVTQELGVDKDREFRYGTETREIVEETEEGPVVKTVKQVSKSGASIYARFFDEYSTSWSKAPQQNQLFLRCQQNYANDLLRARGHVLLNEVYDMLGLERSKEGCVVGWVLDGGSSDNYIDFGIFDHGTFDAMRFVNGDERSILLDFNVDGVVYDKL